LLAKEGRNILQATELEETAADVAKDAEAERSKLQAALDQANAEIERLRTELQQEKAGPSQDGDSISESPEDESGVGR
jgi:signal transduction protein with GAF and PtsI domain